MLLKIPILHVAWLLFKQQYHFLYCSKRGKTYYCHVSAFTLSGIVCLSNSNGYTALHCAVEANKYKMIPLLLQADPLVANKVNKHGKTALHLGCKMNFSKCVISLLVSEYYLPNYQYAQHGVGLFYYVYPNEVILQRKPSR